MVSSVILLVLFAKVDYNSLDVCVIMNFNVVDVEASNCSTGDVRLVGSGDGDEGRLEMCVNRAWGTVCSDEFDTTDASVACGAIEGFNGSGKFITNRF